MTDREQDRHHLVNPELSHRVRIAAAIAGESIKEYTEMALEMRLDNDGQPSRFGLIDPASYSDVRKDTS